MKYECLVYGKKKKMKLVEFCKKSYTPSVSKYKSILTFSKFFIPTLTFVFFFFFFYVI